MKLQLTLFLTIPFYFGCSNAETYTANSSLISAEVVSSYVDSLISDTKNNFVLIDMQSLEEFKKEHIYGAVNVTRDQISNEAYDANGNSSKKDLESLLSSLGVTTNDQIIIYDNKQNTDACRLWWLLTVFGHEKVAVLDGGFDHFKTLKVNLTDNIILREPNEYHFSGKERKDIFASMDDIKTGMQDKNTVILDVRSLEEYKGTKTKDGAAYGGNIKGCEHLEFKSALNEGGSKNQCFKNAEELKKMFAKKGVTPDKKIIVYCHSGTRSANTTFVLTQLMGFKNVSNYDGSWQEWSQSTKK